MDRSTREIILSDDVLQDEGTFKKNKWIFSLGGIGRDMVYTLVSTYFFMYVQFGLTLSVAQFATLSILIGVIGRIWDGINDPLMGTIIDGAHFRWGKFKPWIFWGSLLTGASLLLLFNIRPFGSTDIYGWIYVGIMVVVYLIWEAFFTMNDIGYWGAIPSLSRDRRRRDKLTSMVIFFAGFGNGLITFIVGVFSPGNILNAFTIYSLICALMMIICQTIVAFTIKEGPTDIDPKEKSSLKKTFKIIFKNKQLLWAAFGYLLYDIGNGILSALIYNLYYLEYGYDGSFAIVMILAGGLTGILQALYPIITKRLARRTTQKISTIIMVSGYIFIALIGWTPILPFNPLTLAIGYIFIGCGGAYFYITTLINLTNCVEYNEYLTGERNEAVISSVRPLVVKFSSAFKSLLTTVTLILSGLLVLSQNVSYLETQKKMINDRIIKVDTSSDYQELKFYITKINDYNSRLDGIDKDSHEYDEITMYIEDEINSESSNGIMKRVQTNVEYLDTYQKMYILKTNNDNEIVDFKQIKDFSNSSLDEFFTSDYKYEASFVFSYNDKNNQLVKVNIANEIYNSSNTIGTRIALRTMVTIIPIILISLSLYIQTKKFILSEGFYERMEKAIKERKRG